MALGRGVEKRNGEVFVQFTKDTVFLRYDIKKKKKKDDVLSFLFFPTIVRGSFIFSFALRGSKRKRKKENSLCIVANDQFTRFFPSFPRLSDVQLGA